MRLAGSSSRCAPVDETRSPWHAVAEEDVLGDRQVGSERRLLAHGRHAGVQGIACPFEPSGAPERLDVAGVRRQLTVEDLQQRGLPRAVLAGEAVQLAGTNRYVSAAEGVHTAEALVHADRAKNGLGLRPH